MSTYGIEPLHDRVGRLRHHLEGLGSDGLDTLREALDELGGDVPSGARRRLEGFGADAMDRWARGRERVRELTGRDHDGADLTRGVCAGLAGGLVGTLVMTAFQRAWQQLAEQDGHDETRGQEPGREHVRMRSHPAVHGLGASGTDVPAAGLGSPGFGTAGAAEEPEPGASEPATEQAARRSAEAVTGRSIEGRTKEIAGQGVHYGFGTSAGAVYGALAETTPAVTRGEGLLFGAALMLLADEIAVPALGLAPRPDQTSAKTHAMGLASHLVYGLTCELTRRAVRRAL